MSIANLLPSAQGTIGPPTPGYVGGSTDYTNLQSNDDATSYLEITRGGAQENSVYMDALSASVINTNPKVFFRGRKNTTGFTSDWEVGFRISPNNTIEDLGTVEPSDNTWFDHTGSALARPGGGSWTPNDFTGAVTGAAELFQRAGVGANTGTNHDYTYTYAIVDHEVQASGFVMYLASWIPVLINVASHGLTRQDVISFFEQYKHTADRHWGFRIYPNRPWEFDKIRAALLRRPTFCHIRPTAGTVTP